MEGFKCEDLKIKFNEDGFLVISGEMEVETKNSSSKKSFNKSFCLQNIDIEKTSSVLSSDGVLVLTIPKKVSVFFQIY